MKGIYIIKNIITDNFYIGSSNNIHKRILEHFNNLKRNKHPNKYLQNSYNKYKIENFSYEILELCNDNVTKNELLNIEQSYISNYDFNKLFNLNENVHTNGSDLLKLKCYLLDLNGNILNTFDSLIELSKYLNVRQVPSNLYNTSKIFLKKYRVVTKEFYNNNCNIIITWNKNYYKKDEYLNHYKFDSNLRKFVVFDENEISAIVSDEKYAIKLSKLLVEIKYENK